MLWIISAVFILTAIVRVSVSLGRSLDCLSCLVVGHHRNNPGLHGHFLQYAKNVLVALPESEFSVLQSLLRGKFLDQEGRRSKIVSWYAREEVVSDLEMETTVKERNVVGTDNVACRTKLAMGEGFSRAQILRRA